jgi:hypothetical protein
MKLAMTALAGAVTIAFAQIAVAQSATDTTQYPTTRSPGVNTEQDQPNMPYSQRGNTSYPGQESTPHPQQGTQNSSNDRYENNAASGGETRDRHDERHDKGKHKGQYKHDNDRHARGDDDRGHSGRE